MAQWFGAEFSFYGFQFQNWMPVTAGAILLLILYNWAHDYG
jgi:hypothetical protein